LHWVRMSMMVDNTQYVGFLVFMAARVGGGVKERKKILHTFHSILILITVRFLLTLRRCGQPFVRRGGKWTSWAGAPPRACATPGRILRGNHPGTARGSLKTYLPFCCIGVFGWHEYLTLKQDMSGLRGCTLIFQYCSYLILQGSK